jgi:hypothetical protein
MAIGSIHSNPSFPTPSFRFHRHLAFTLGHERTKRLHSTDVVIPAFGKGILQQVTDRTTSHANTRIKPLIKGETKSKLEEGSTG